MKFISLQNLPIISNYDKNNKTDKKRIASTFLLNKVFKASSDPIQPSCVVTWMKEEIFHTPPKVFEQSPLMWSDNDDCNIYLKIPKQIDEMMGNESALSIFVHDYSKGSKGVFLGKLNFTFASLLKLYSGTFTFLLKDDDLVYDKNIHQYKPNNHLGEVRGSLTFSIDFYYPYWDSMQVIIPHKYTRKLIIFSANNLPYINDKEPCTKCIIYYDGVIKAKTIVMPYTTSPSWPQISVDIIIDTEKENLEIIDIRRESHSAKDSGQRPVFKEMGWEYKKYEIPTISIDKYCLDNNISYVDFIKIDVEGAEMMVLKGCQQLFQNNAINLIHFEYGNTFQDAGITLYDVKDFVEKYGYNIYYFEDNKFNKIDTLNIKQYAKISIVNFVIKK